MILISLMQWPNVPKIFEFESNSAYLGRSPDNSIQIKDRFISRRHLKILKRDNIYTIMDLHSKNGTFIDGKQISPGTEMEVKEGIPIAIGMSVISMGKPCSEELLAHIDSNLHDKSISRIGEALVNDRSMTLKNNMDLINKVSHLLMQSVELNEILEKILYCIFNLLKRIDRGVILVIDNETGKIIEQVFRFRSSVHGNVMDYSRDVVAKVITEGKELIVSDVHSESDGDLADTLKLMKIGSVMCGPLISGSQIRGVIYVDTIDKTHGFRKEDLSLFTALSSLATLAIVKRGQPLLTLEK